MNLLITGAWKTGRVYIEKLEKMGHSIEFIEFETDEIPCDYDWIEGVVCNGLFLSHSIEKFVNLKYIQLTSAGFDRISMDYVNDHEIEIHNARGVYSIPMAEFAVYGVLELYKQGKKFWKNQKLHKWEKQRDLLELLGKNICIIGCGSVGTECAKRFQGFGCQIVGVDKYARYDQYFDKMLGIENMETILPESDVVILTIPLTGDTRHWMNEKKLKLMKDSAVLVNIARGAVVDTEALIQRLPCLGGAVLDVFEEEPLGEESVLWDMENVIMTPHNSFIGERNEERLVSIIFSNLYAYKDVN
ncbi:MAG: NAD(P)-dependent oxidoreductase [bacterium]|nr:NAD(P)-dependent oxidoreductase [bacterium]